MRMLTGRRLPMQAFALAMSTGLLAGAPASAQTSDIEAFYKGRQMRIVIGSSPGAGFDAFGRAVARHLPNFLPGKPTIVASNLTGAGSMRAVQSLQAEAKDGTYIVAFNPGQIIFTLLDPDQFKGFKFTDVAFLGSATADVRVCWAWHTSGVKTFQDLLKKDKFATGHTGIGAATYIDAAVVKNVFGARINQIVGYPGASEQRIAVERGELDGDCGTSESVPAQWLAEGKATIFLRISKATDETIPKVPWIGDLGTPEQRRLIEFVLFYHDMFRPFIVSREVPQERLAALRTAFARMVEDKDFRAEAKKLGRDVVGPMTGEEVERVITQIYRAPKELLAEAARIIK